MSRTVVGSRADAPPTEKREVVIYRVLADLVMLFHFAVILFIVMGGFLTWRWPRLAWVHLPAVAYGISISLVGWVCPLTPLESELRLRAGQRGFEGGFVEHYILPIIYPPGLTPQIQVLFALGLILLMGLAYGIPLWRSRQTQ